MPEPADAPKVAERSRRRGPLIAALAAGGLLLVGVGTYAATRHDGGSPGAGSSAAAAALTLTAQQCAPQWRGMPAGPGTLTVTNRAAVSAEVLMIDSAGRTLTQIETVGPGTTASTPMVAAAGSYRIQCVLSGGTVLTSKAAAIRGSSSVSAPPAIAKATDAELQPATAQYQAYVDRSLVTLASQVATLDADLKSGNLPAARTSWLNAQLTWCQLGAAYGSFGQLGTQIDGLAQGLPGGVDATSWRGLHRIEYGLWHGGSAKSLEPIAWQLGQDVHTLQLAMPGPGGIADDQKSAAVAPADLPLRAHEILEDTQRDRLSGQADYGSGTEYQQAAADLTATKVVLGYLQPVLAKRSSTVVSSSDSALASLDSALRATKRWGEWVPMGQVPQAAQLAVNGRLGAALEVLADVPQLLEQVNAHDPAQPDIS